MERPGRGEARPLGMGRHSFCRRGERTSTQREKKELGTRSEPFPGEKGKKENCGEPKEKGWLSSCRRGKGHVLQEKKNGKILGGGEGGTTLLPCGGALQSSKKGERGGKGGKIKKIEVRSRLKSHGKKKKTRMRIWGGETEGPPQERKTLIIMLRVKKRVRDWGEK